jgi:uncharacterized protein YjiS (DUF1127 family)
MSQSSVLETRRASSRAGILSSWFRRMEIWLFRRHGWQDLSLLDDRLLEDVGISREEVLWNAGKPFWRP